MNHKPSFEKIDILNRELKSVFSSLSSKISDVESRLLAIELDYMYGNMTDAAYAEVMALMDQKIQSITNALLELQRAESLLR
jgi:hypothetical protein